MEERIGTTASAERQFVWGLRYIDDLILQDRSTANNGTINERRYAMQDGNWNTIAICDITGSVGERYAYSAYGSPVFMNGSGTVQTSSAIGFETLYAGYRWDGATPQMYYVRNRFLLPVIGTWNRRDPLGYVDGYNLMMMYGAVRAVDPFGTSQDAGGIDTPWGWTADPAFEPNPWLEKLNPDYNKFACCMMKESGKAPFPATVPCGDSETPFGCCLRAAAGIFTSWEVMKARRGMCGVTNIRPADPPLHGFPPMISPSPLKGGGIATKPLPVRFPANPTPGTGTCTGPWPWVRPEEPRMPPRLKKGMVRCTAKARNWNVGTDCYGKIFEGVAETLDEAYDIAFDACVEAGCHAPRTAGDCGHITCR